MKICKNCKHYSYGRCMMSIGKIDMISGEKLVCPLEARDIRFAENYCGAEGKWYEEKLKL